MLVFGLIAIPKYSIISIEKESLSDAHAILVEYIANDQTRSRTVRYDSELDRDEAFFNYVTQYSHTGTGLVYT